MNKPDWMPAAGTHGIAQLDGRVDGGLVLGAQARLVAVGPDLLHAERPAGQQRERQGGPEDLAAALAERLGALPMPVRILVADDAVDSGTTLASVLHLLADICPPGTEIRSAAITQTLENPRARPDYVLLHGTLCRFPWSFDAAA